MTKEKDRYFKVIEILKELDDGYYDQEKDDYPPFALTPWDDRERYRDYIYRVLRRLVDEGKL